MRKAFTCMGIGWIMMTTGCQDKNAIAPPAQSASADYGMQTDYQIPAVVESSPSTTTDDTVYLASTTTGFNDAYTADSATRTHVVGKGDTLFRIARTYYSNAAKWRDIYQANRNVLTDPNKLRVGDQLVIP